MGIEVSTRLIHVSIAQVLHEISPDAEIFDNPNQQGTPYPAWFIVHRSPVEIRREIRRYYITYYIDVWYLIKQNVTQMFDQYTRIAEQLADKMEYIPVYGHEGVVLHTFETSWSIEMTAMKYSVTLRLVCSRDNGVPQPKMEVIEDFYAFIKGLKPIARLTFCNTSHPELPVELPEPLFVYADEPFVLPSVVGVYPDADGTLWEPSRWSIGGFGESIVVSESTETDLEWDEIRLCREPIGLAQCTGVGVVYRNDGIAELPPLEYIVANEDGAIVWGGKEDRAYGLMSSRDTGNGDNIYAPLVCANVGNGELIIGTADNT